MDIKPKIVRALLDSHIPPHYSGFTLLLDSMLLLFENEELTILMTKRLYPKLATRHGMTAVAVERSIRTAVRKSGYTGTSGKFITSLYWTLRIDLGWGEK